MSTARAEHTATLLPSGQVLVAGGCQYGPCDDALASAEVYDPATHNWLPAGAMNTARALHTATLLPSGQVLVTGGVGSDGGFLASAEVYDTVTSPFKVTFFPSTQPKGVRLIRGASSCA
jgi:hypothetical protein